MRCLVCNAEMILMKVDQDDTMPVPGFERRTFMCSECHDVERRFVFTKNAREGETVQVAPPIAGEQSNNEPIAGEQGDNEPMPLEGEPEPVQVAPPIAGEQDDNQPVPLEGEPVQVAPPITGEQGDNEPMPLESEPAPVQVASSIASEQDYYEPMLGDGEPEPAQVAPSIADEQTVNEPMPGEGDLAPIAPASTSEDQGKVTFGLIRRVMAKVRVEAGNRRSHNKSLVASALTTTLLWISSSFHLVPSLRRSIIRCRLTVGLPDAMRFVRRRNAPSSGR